jgi:hypothetical protein
MDGAGTKQAEAALVRLLQNLRVLQPIEDFGISLPLGSENKI